MYVARILYPVEVLGPGKRVGIWFAGCPRRCKGCSNPELWEFRERYKTTPETVMGLVERIAAGNVIDGFTLTGGDPMYQPEELGRFIPMLQTISEDILVYTGYTIGQLPASSLRGVSVLIDGEYIESRNTGCPLRGSDNQVIHILDDRFSERYGEYLAVAAGRIQNFMTSDGIVSVGIHRPNFMSELNSEISKKGLMSDAQAKKQSGRP